MIKGREIIYLSFFQLILFCSCGRSEQYDISERPKVSNVVELQDWIQNNQTKLINTRELGGLELRVKYLPSTEETSSEFSFLLNIAPQKQENLFAKPNEFFPSNESKMMYWSSGIQRQLTLITDKDTIPCTLVIYENTGNIRNDLSVNIGFSSQKTGHKKFTLVYDDIYFGLGRLNFTFDQIINNIPLIQPSN